MILVSLFHFGRLSSNVCWFLSIENHLPLKALGPCRSPCVGGINYGGRGGSTVQDVDFHFIPCIHPALQSVLIGASLEQFLPRIRLSLPQWCWGRDGGRLREPLGEGQGPTSLCSGFSHPFPSLPFPSSLRPRYGYLQPWAFPGLWDELISFKFMCLTKLQIHRGCASLCACSGAY